MSAATAETTITRAAKEWITRLARGQLGNLKGAGHLPSSRHVLHPSTPGNEVWSRARRRRSSLRAAAAPGVSQRC
jgi:hypothetical protein